MGYGPIINGKQRPITPWIGSWAQQEQERKLKGIPLKTERQIIQQRQADQAILRMAEYYHGQ